MQMLDGLNESQLSAVKHTKGAAVIDAGPGAGKTKTLTTRTAYLIENKIPSGRILALSFTRKASEEMAERVKNLTGASVAITTFHKWAGSTLRESGISYRTLSPAAQTDWFKKTLKGLEQTGENDVRRVMTIIDKAKNNGFITVEEWRKSHFAEKLEEEQRELISSVWNDYRKFCEKSKMIDLTDLLTLFYSSWKKELQKGSGRILNAVSRTDHLMVDEFQDTNPVQMKLLKLWAKPQEQNGWTNERGFPTSFVVCGDVDQAIYGFRGSEPRIFLNFRRQFENCQIYELGENYRSQKKIVTQALEVVSNNVERTLKKIKPIRPEGLSPQIYAAADRRDEIDWVLNEIGELQERGEYEIAVLARHNSLLEEFQKSLTNLGYQVQGENFLRLEEVEVVRNLLKISVEIHPKWVEKAVPERLKPNLRRAFVAHRKTGVSLFEALASDADMIDWVETVRRIGVFTGRGEYGKALAEAFNFNNFFQNSFRQMSETVTHFSRVEKILMLIREAEKIDLKKERLGVRAVLDLLSDEKKVNSPIDLLTIHGSKGGEWKHVFMVGLNAEYFPGNDFDTLEEERRVFYVGMTRAKETLSMSGLKHNICPFVAEMNPDVLWIEKQSA